MTDEDRIQLATSFIVALRAGDVNGFRAIMTDDVVWTLPGTSLVSGIAKGVEGVLKGKKVVVLTSRGGAFRPGTPTAQYDHQEPYLRHILGFIGLTDITFIHAENQKPGDLADPARAAAIEQAQLAASATPRPVTAQDLQL